MLWFQEDSLNTVGFRTFRTLRGGGRGFGHRGWAACFAHKGYWVTVWIVIISPLQGMCYGKLSPGTHISLILLMMDDWMVLLPSVAFIDFLYLYEASYKVWQWKWALYLACLHFEPGHSFVLLKFKSLRWILLVATTDDWCPSLPFVFVFLFVSLYLCDFYDICYTSVSVFVLYMWFLYDICCTSVSRCKWRGPGGPLPVFGTFAVMQNYSRKAGHGCVREIQNWGEEKYRIGK